MHWVKGKIQSLIKCVECVYIKCSVLKLYVDHLVNRIFVFLYRCKRYIKFVSFFSFMRVEQKNGLFHQMYTWKMQSKVKEVLVRNGHSFACEFSLTALWCGCMYVESAENLRGWSSFRYFSFRGVYLCLGYNKAFCFCFT